MPIYEYHCDACGFDFEQLQKFSDDPLTVCPRCNEARVRRLLSTPAIVFKGSGWYVTDSKRKVRDGVRESGSSESGDGPAPSAEDGGTTETAPAPDTSTAGGISPEPPAAGESQASGAGEAKANGSSGGSSSGDAKNDQPAAKSTKKPSKT